MNEWMNKITTVYSEYDSGVLKTWNFELKAWNHKSN
jgi:hypothetical protein